jgi:hypothetical protein
MGIPISLSTTLETGIPVSRTESVESVLAETGNPATAPVAAAPPVRIPLPVVALPVPLPLVPAPAVMPTEVRDERRPIRGPRTRRKPALMAAHEVARPVAIQAAIERIGNAGKDHCETVTKPSVDDEHERRIAEGQAFLERRAAERAREKSNLTTLSVKGLRKLAVERGLPGSRLMRRQQLLDLLTAAPDA